MFYTNNLFILDTRDPGNCKEYTEGEFDQCVDAELQKVWNIILAV